jgi:CHAT domain/Tetratricopeptide repeat
VAPGVFPGKSALGGDADVLEDAAVPDRDAALAALKVHLVFAAKDPASILRRKATRAAKAVLAAVGPDPAADLPAVHALGWYHWLRYQVLPKGRDQADLAAIVRLLAPVYLADPGAVPEPVGQFFARLAMSAPDPDTDPAVLVNHAINLIQAYERGGQRDLLDQAVTLFRAALAATPQDHPDRVGRLNNLGNALRTLFDRTGDQDTLVEAVQLGRDAVAAIPQNHPHRAMCLSNVGATLRILFEWTGDQDTLMEAVQLGRDAVAATPQNHPRRAAHLNNLGNALQVLFGRTGDQDTLMEAVQVGRDAVAATLQSDPKRAMHLNNLGNVLRTLFELTGEQAVLAEAVQVGRDVVAATSQSDPNRPMHLNNLGNALRTLFELTGDQDTLMEGVQVGRDVVAATSQSDPNRPMHLNNLGNALRTLFELTGDQDTLMEAMQLGRDAVAATPQSHTNRAMYLSNVGITLQVLFGRTGEQAVLAEAVQVGRDAVAATPQNHPTRASQLNNLGLGLRMLFEHTGDRGTLEEACRCHREAADGTTGGTMDRIGAYRQLALLSPDTGNTQEGLQAVEAAIDLVDILAPGSLARSDREFQIGRLVDLAGEAAAAALAAGRPKRAVELLERTRGILAADTLGIRGHDLTRLRDHATHAHLADRLEQLRSRLDALDQTRRTPSPEPGATDSRQAAMEADRRLAADRSGAHAAWRDLLDQIRALPGFADFLRPPPVTDLARHAHDGPIVFVTTSPARCDALILTDTLDPVQVIPLTGLAQDDAYAYARRLLTARRAATDSGRDAAARQTAQQDILAVLAWLWDTVTEPVLTHLGHTTTPTGDTPWPRVWWCPVGILAFLPLHAAGHHNAPADETGSSRTVLDRVVSSYTPTVRALAHARTPRTPTTAPTPALVVPVPDLPGAELPGVTLETTAITTLIPNTRLLTRPTRSAVLRALPEHRIAHFSCHAYADWNQPAHSSLILNDHATAPLTVTDITALNLNADLAYLSACDTAVTVPRLADESLHITAAFHLAGYRHVIGTLWPVNDHAAAELTAAFYTHLTTQGTTPPQPDNAAHALHYATRRQRTRYPHTPTLWATHTHTGT